MKLTVQKIIKETPEAVTVCFKNGNLFRKIKYLPGQFLMFDFKIGKEMHRRAYSFSSSPDTETELRITVKKVKGGIVSNYINDNLKIGDKIKTDVAMGGFFVEPEKERSTQYVLFGGGSGITPVYSIAKSVLLKEPNSKVLLIYANQNEESVIFSKEIDLLAYNYPEAFKVEHIITETKKEEYYKGFLTAEVLVDIFNKHNLSFSDHKYMMCGPSGFMDKAIELLKQEGIERNQIKIEAFKAATIKVAPKDFVSKVTIIHKNKNYEIEVPGDKNILQEAMSNNIPLPYSCRSGMCSTCKGKCISGETAMTAGHLLTDEQVQSGEVLTCITYPKTEEVTIEIDS